MAKDVSEDLLAAMTAGWASSAAYRIVADLNATGEALDEEDLTEVESQALEEAAQTSAMLADRCRGDARAAIDKGLDLARGLFARFRTKRLS